MDITVTRHNLCDVISIKGRVDSYTSPTLSEQVRKLLSEERCNLIFDMSEVGYVSSAGLRVFIDVQKSCKRDRMGEVILVGVPQRIYETLELAGFTPLFAFYPDTSSAVASFTGTIGNA